MNKQYRMTDTRDLEGTGSLIVEQETREGSNVWTNVSTHFFYKGKLVDITVYADTVEEVNMVQYTENRSVWTKSQRQNGKTPWGWMNITRIQRKNAPLKKKGDC